MVIAAVSPLAKDVSHSTNTLGYAAPLRVAAAASVHVERDPRDPALWNNAQMVEWVGTVVASAGLDPSAIVGSLTGVQLCALPEPELFRRGACMCQRLCCYRPDLRAP